MLKISNYKCFGETPEGFEQLKLFNVIVGRNNIGKSTIIELVQLSVEMNQQPVRDSLLGNGIEIHYTVVLDEELLRRVFLNHISGGAIDGNHWEFGKRWVGTTISLAMGSQGQTRVTHFDPADKLSEAAQAHYAQDISGLISRPPYQDCTFVKVAADRNVIPEAESDSEALQHNGAGLTNVIRVVLTHAGRNRDLVARHMLQELNSIFRPDGQFEEILVLKNKLNLWEIYLRQIGGQALPLSQLGSGLKTILMVLAIFHLGPMPVRPDSSKVIHAFEELENNLHPAALRRLLNYIRAIAIEKRFRIFFSTHSSATIDFFSRDPEAQIVHLVREGSRTVVRTVATYVDRRGILDDLDVRASDLLQANGLIWVEGPSDRIYLNRWIAIASNEKLKEGSHYQIVFYGGRLLSHLTAEPDRDDLINVFSINRNAIVVIDSDRRTASSLLNATKLRIKAEVEKIGGLAWVTEGREIENYLPGSLIKSTLKISEEPASVGKYNDFFEMLNADKNHKEGYWKEHKPLLAERVTEQMTSANAFAQWDLDERIKEMTRRIGNWNST